MSWPWIIVYCMLSVLCLSPGSVTMATGQGQVTEVKVLEGQRKSDVLRRKKEMELEMKFIKLLSLQVLPQPARFTHAMVHQDGDMLHLVTPPA